MAGIDKQEAMKELVSATLDEMRKLDLNLGECTLVIRALAETVQAMQNNTPINAFPAEKEEPAPTEPVKEK